MSRSTAYAIRNKSLKFRAIESINENIKKNFVSVAFIHACLSVPCNNCIMIVIGTHPKTSKKNKGTLDPVG